MTSNRPQHPILATSALTMADGSNVFLAASVLGLMRSTDDGATWHDAYASLGPEAPITTMAIAASPSFDDDQYLLAGAIDGVLVSNDAGATWSALTLPPPPPAISSFVFSPTFSEDGFVFAGTLEDGVYRSGNRGAQWEAWNFGLTDLNVLDLAISPDFSVDETLLAATESGVYRSTNRGRSWREIPFPTDLSPVISLAVSPLYGTDHTLFAGTESLGLHRSNDDGDNWTQLGDGDIEGAVNALVVSCDHRSRPHLLILVDDRILLSLDGGDSWSDMRLDQVPHATVASIAPISPVGPITQLLIGLVDGTVGKTGARIPGYHT